MNARRATLGMPPSYLAIAVTVWVLWALPARAEGIQRCDCDQCIVVMSENIYLGADVVPVIRAAFFGHRCAIIRQVSRFWQDVLATDFSERADVIARQIIENRADFVAIQEAALFRTGIPDGLSGNQEPAEHVELDYLQILLDKLTAYGGRYTAVVVSNGADIELPGYVTPPGTCRASLLRDIRLTDRLAILVRDDPAGTVIRVGNTQGGRFDAKVVFPVGLKGQTIDIHRGWNSVDVGFGPAQFRLINMCLETNPFPRIQTRQAKELLRGPAETELPVILVGDSNSDANKPLSCAYRRLIRSGFFDAWDQTHFRDPGYTYGNDPDLRNPTAMTHHPLSLRPNRFDQILCRGQLRAIRMERVGVAPLERTVTGMWPSDHAGVIATICVGGK